MRNIIAIVFIMLFLASCASQIMQSYVGKDINEVVLDYGEPSKIINLANGKRAYQWHKSANIYIPGHTTSYTSGSANISGFGNNAYVNGSSVTNTYSTPAKSYTKNCYYTFNTKQKGEQWIITSFRTPPLACE